MTDDSSPHLTRRNQRLANKCNGPVVATLFREFNLTIRRMWELERSRDTHPVRATWQVCGHIFWLQVAHSSRFPTIQPLMLPFNSGGWKIVKSALKSIDRILWSRDEGGGDEIEIPSTKHAGRRKPGTAEALWSGSGNLWRFSSDWRGH